MANFKPGDKVWIENKGGAYPAGTYKAVVAGAAPMPTPHGGFIPGWWIVDIEGWPPHPQGYVGNEKFMWPRDDPPPQQEPKREDVGSWDKCHWKPPVEEIA